jgi:carboxylate-amine ligase
MMLPDPAGHGMTFNGQPFDIEPVPRIIDETVWTGLAAGVEQRARALDHFLADVYGASAPEDAGIVRAGRMDAAVIRRAPGYTELGHRVPGGTIRACVTGADLVCSGTEQQISDWRVLEDNLRMPSGLTFALAARQVTEEHHPEPIEAMGDRLVPTDGALEMLCDAVRDASDHAVLLTAGEDDPSWDEQRIIAETGDLAPRTCDQLEVVERGTPVLWDLDGDRLVDLVYLRVTESHLAAGVPGIGDALAAGTVRIVNAPGNGLADDKAVYASVPEMVRFYLGEEPALQQVRTWLCADPGQRLTVLDRLDELVVKPVDGYGGSGITVGPECTRAQLAARRAEILADPASFIGQERVELSTLPALDGTDRHVDLRMFSLLDSGGATTVRVGLTRVAPAGSTVVNSSRGGGGRDTWILTADPLR